ncbi:hypothetical protein HanHA300_Chr10g0365181 [Helianthus annuus]|nr:hypothetical protein HanHA300_Chr10g0365181 [Helianthus annuus]KAJ0530186.1 hypothetical protein HanHA89_Chr10g0386781 [Helianthus annuus]KAJ0697058.1 hypothetical protein HanLR1_Chr10g0364451 [Helianthus annuus]
MMSLNLTDVHVCGECRLRGFSIIMKDRKIEDRVKSKGLYGKDRSHSLTNVGPKY